MDDQKKRFQLGFIGSLGFHLLIFLFLAFSGYLVSTSAEDKVVEIAVFGGGGGGGGPNEIGMTKHSQEEVKNLPNSNKTHQNVTPSIPKSTDDIIEKTHNSTETMANGATNSADGNSTTGEGSGGGTGGGQGMGSGSGTGDGTGEGMGTGIGGGYAGGDPTSSPAIPPRLLSNIQPNYPSNARRANIEGTTTLRVLIGYEGEIESVVVSSSSGNDELDSAAVDAMYGWRFDGARNGGGQKIRCYTYIPIRFRLN